MGKEIASQAEHHKQHMDEAMMCQFVALLNEKWGKLERAKPKLTLIQGGRGARHE